MAYSYDDFLTAANKSGLMSQFSSADLDTAQKNPEFGMSILNLKQNYANASTAEEKALINAQANALRDSYGSYSGGTNGAQYISSGKIPTEIDNVLDQLGSYGSFSYDTDAPTYENQYAAYQQQLLDDILNREDFSWSKETDPLYSTYKKSYLREGDRATANALAQASAASGGRPSSYAVTAATQAGDYYAAQLNDVIPTLYQQAYDKYLDEYSMMQQDLSAVNNQEQLDYQKYLDELSQYNTDRSFAYNQYLDDYSRLLSNLTALQSQDAVDSAAASDLYNQTLNRAALLANAGDYSAYGALYGLTDAQTQALSSQYDQTAAQALADYYAGYGDYSQLAALGVDTSYLQALQAAELASAAGTYSSRSSNGSTGSSKTSDEDDTGDEESIDDIYTYLYNAGIKTKGQAYAALLAMDNKNYNSTEADKIAAYYAEMLEDGSFETTKKASTGATSATGTRIETTSGMSDSYFRQMMATLSAQLNPTTGSAQDDIEEQLTKGLDKAWGKMSGAQQKQLNALLASYGYQYEG